LRHIFNKPTISSQIVLHRLNRLILPAVMAPRTKQTARKWVGPIGNKELQNKAARKSSPVVGGIKKHHR
jgi:hypothetical protein